MSEEEFTIHVTPEEHAALMQLSMDCVAINEDGDDHFNEARWIQGCREILGDRVPVNLPATRRIVVVHGGTRP